METRKTDGGRWPRSQGTGSSGGRRAVGGPGAVLRDDPAGRTPVVRSSAGLPPQLGSRVVASEDLAEPRAAPGHPVRPELAHSHAVSVPLPRETELPGDRDDLHLQIADLGVSGRLPEFRAP